MPETVTIACKLPLGLILRLQEEVEDTEPTPLGYKKVKVWRPIGKEYKVAGCAVAFGQFPENPHVAGYALTPGIPADFWETWCKQNKDNDALKGGLIFAHKSPDQVRDQAREQRREGVVSGMEPLDPNRPPRGMTARGMKVTVADEQPAPRIPRKRMDS